MQLQTQPDIAEYRLLTSRLAAVRFHKLSEPGRLSVLSFARVSQKREASIRRDRLFTSTRDRSGSLLPSVH